MKRFMTLSLILFGVGIALVVYAVVFGPNKFSRAARDSQNPVGQIQYNTPDGSPQKPWLETHKNDSAQPAGR